MKKPDIIIIGAGAAGLAAALYCAKYSDGNCNITVLEHKKKPAAKLFATGNGRCNFANDIIDAESYRGDDPQFAYSIADRFPAASIIDFMEELGIVTCNINGYYYPRSQQAATVAECMLSRLNSYGVSIECGQDVREVKPHKDGYIVITKDSEYYADTVIAAAGGKSYASLGSDGSGYRILGQMGHKVNKPLPGLTGLTAKGLRFEVCQGVRAKGRISIHINGHEAAASYGEIQYADYGISGIPVFQISRYAIKALDNGSNVTAYIDSVQEYDYNELLDKLIVQKASNPYKSTAEMLNGYIPLKLADAIAYNCGIKPDTIISKLSHNDLKELCIGLKKQSITITGNSGFDKAQITVGGVATSEVDCYTMESLLHKNLYIVGETLDIDGNCGGYNLHFAFATGMAAGMAAGSNVKLKYGNDTRRK